MSPICIIPARLKSSRFPRKILAPFGSSSLLHYVWKAAKETALFSAIYIALDAEETATHVQNFGASFVFTSPDCPSGSMRIAEAAEKLGIENQVVVGWQADEPFITPSTMHTLLHTIKSCPAADVWSLKKKIREKEEMLSPHVVKVVCNHAEYALYFSRSLIPHYRDKDALEGTYYKHIGLYAYAPHILPKLSSLPSSPLEEAEKLEQLSFLQAGWKIKMANTEEEIKGIDTPSQMELARLHLEKLTQRLT